MSAARATHYTALVLAGRRGGADVVAATAGQTHKCFVEVAGVPMLVRVLQALEASTWVARVVLCIDAQCLDFPGISTRLAAGRLAHIASGASAAQSALRAFDAHAAALPLLVVTGDHPLLTPEMIDHFCAAAADSGDAAVALAPSARVFAAHPQAVRTLLRFADGPFCGCNLYALNTPAARAAVVFWNEVETARKRPWRLMSLLGIDALLRYWRGRLTSAEVMARVSRRLGLQARVVIMPFAEAAIDVDKLEDLRLAEAILRARETR